MRKISLPNNTLIFFIAIIILRLIAMWWVPLTDTTEARYGEIARKMVETNDWITPWYDYGVPFWAKPPLSTWLSALSIKLFGLSEFSVRISSLLLAFAVAALSWCFAQSYLEKPIRWLAMIILSSMPLIYLAGGMVMTDMSLAFACTLTLVSFWFAVEEANRKWGYVFFLALGISMLTKGPAAVVLGLLPIFFWLLWTNNWQKMWRVLPWLGGITLMLIVFMPWYVMAEIKTPGFLHYFIVGEHIDRFLISGWKGDRYGHAHSQPLGMIWVFLLVDTLPWLFIVVPWLIYRKFKLKSPLIILSPALSSQQKYLWCWFLAPLVFFTFAHNIILSYAMTALPALAILLSQSLAPIALKNGKNKSWVYMAGLFAPTALLLLTVYTMINPDTGKNSARNISHLFHTFYVKNSQHLSYVGGRLYSMEFYNAGKVNHFDSINQAFANLQPNSPMFIALTNEQAQSLTEVQKQHLKLKASTKRYQLYEARLGASQ